MLQLQFQFVGSFKKNKYILCCILLIILSKLHKMIHKIRNINKKFQQFVQEVTHFRQELFVVCKWQKYIELNNMLCRLSVCGQYSIYNLMKQLCAHEWMARVPCHRCAVLSNMRTHSQNYVNSVKRTPLRRQCDGQPIPSGMLGIFERFSVFLPDN